MEEALQARGWVEIVYGGYNGEEKGAGNSLDPQFVDVPMQGELTVDYFYRDTNYAVNSPTLNLNNSSSRVDVKMKTSWDATRGENNIYNIHTETYILSIARSDKRESLAPIAYNPTRTINVSGTVGTVLTNLISSPANTGVIWSGNKLVSSNDYKVKPGQAVSPNELSAFYLNYTTGYWNPPPTPSNTPSPFVDGMRMGVQFKNNLPDRCDDPVLSSVTQTPDICENEIEACFSFAPCSCTGMGLRFEYHYDGESWEMAKGAGQIVDMPASSTSLNTFCLQHLPPTNHTNNPVIIYWRAKYYPITAEMPETDWATGDVDMVFILHPHETVPDISPQECSKLERGELIENYESETCYNEFSCAD